jgi:hypothetical protein
MHVKSREYKVMVDSSLCVDLEAALSSIRDETEIWHDPSACGSPGSLMLGKLKGTHDTFPPIHRISRCVKTGYCCVNA